MKRTPLKRGKPLRRRSWIRTTRKTAYQRRPRDRAYMDWIRSHPCAAEGLSPCAGPIESDHTGRRGLSRKAHDRTFIPLCKLHHRQRTDFSGPFRAWDKDQMRRWLDGTLQWYQHEYAKGFRR